MPIKAFMIHDDNQSFVYLPCRYKIVGNLQKRELVCKIHKKKCDVCKNFSVKYLSSVMPDEVPIKKQNWKDYTAEKYVIDKPATMTKADFLENKL